MDQRNNQKDTYFVAVKIFLQYKEQFLILRDNFGDWDLPGGRIQKDEFEVLLEDIIHRKLSEELGRDIRYRIGKPVLFMRHQRHEQSPGNPMVRIFAVGYEGILESGVIHLSPRHVGMKWVDPKNFHPEDYFTGGWLQGVKEYLALHKN
jgi:8-oxo-dGTP pyrophosphatase MutT (NUDIX family)